MADVKKATPNTRTVTVLILVFSLLALFLLPYFFYFMPVNESTLHQQGFLKLSRAAQIIIDKQKDYKNFSKYAKISMDTLSDSSLNTQSCRNNKGDSLCFVYDNSGGWKIVYKMNKVPSKPSSFLTYQFPLSDFVAPCLTSAKELFESLSLVHYCDRGGKDSTSALIYQDDPEKMEYSLNVDSLAPRRQGVRSPDITDIRIEGINYKMFTWPFQISSHKLILCGFLKASAYNSRVRVMPVSIVYILFISLFLFFLSLPVWKVFIMNELDRLNMTNVKTSIAFLLISSTFLTLAIVQFSLLHRGNREVKENLRKLSGKVAASLGTELTEARDEMISLEKLRLKKLKDSSRMRSDTARPDTSAGTKVRKGKVPVFWFGNIPDPNKNKDSAGRGRLTSVKEILWDDTAYYHSFYHVSWINNEGQVREQGSFSDLQLLKILAKKGSSYNFLDVTQRDYYTYFKNRKSREPLSDSLLLIAPVYSWTNNEFRVNICRKSNLPDRLMQTMQTRLYSVLNTVLPAGYGFCLIRANGDVLIHSNPSKSLRENFFEETNRSYQIRRVINSRQTDSLSNVSFYGKFNELRIQPLAQHPLFLVFYHDNSYLEPVNIRILFFAVLFCLVVYAFMILLILAFYRAPRRSFLFSSTDYYNWLLPQSNFRSIYYNGGIFLLFFLLVQVLSAMIMNAAGMDDFDYSWVAVTAIIPFNILFGLKLLRLGNRPSTYKRTLGHIAVPVMVSCALYGWAGFYHPLLLSSFVGFEGVFILLMAGISYKNGKLWYALTKGLSDRVTRMRWWRRASGKDRTIFLYGWFVTLFILTMAIFPGLVFSWFGTNHEWRQTIRKEQLLLAQGLRKREMDNRFFIRTYQPAKSVAGDLFSDLQYTKGIYPVYHDKIIYGMGLRRIPDSSAHLCPAEPFYLDITNALGSRNDDTSFLPALMDSSQHDNLYHWDSYADTIVFDYSHPEWKVPPADPGKSNPDLAFRIRSYSSSESPYFLAAPLMIVLVTILMVICLFRLVTTMAAKFFYPRKTEEIDGLMTNSKVLEEGIWKKSWDQVVDNFALKEIVSGPEEIPALLKKEYADFMVHKSTDIAEMEMELTLRAEKLKLLFDCAWKNCSPEERFLLYGLAGDGLMNHKNESLVYKLLRNKLICIDQERIKLISYSFRNYILSKRGTDEERELLVKMQTASSWTTIRTVFIVIILTVLVFLFLTQQDVSGKIIAIITGLTTVIPLLLKFLSLKKDEPAKKD
ncbi:hypothetical protein ACX0G9_11025 [Flavitalea flava]